MSAKPPGEGDERSFGAADLYALDKEASPTPAAAPALWLHRIIKHEMEQYDAEASIDPESSPLSWWQRNERRFPNMSTVTRHLLSIPASTAELERMFSRASTVAGPRRPRLLPESATKVMFCHENIRRGVF